MSDKESDIAVEASAEGPATLGTSFRVSAAEHAALRAMVKRLGLRSIAQFMTVIAREADDIERAVRPVIERVKSREVEELIKEQEMRLARDELKKRVKTMSPEQLSRALAEVQRIEDQRTQEKGNGDAC